MSELQTLARLARVQVRMDGGQCISVGMYSERRAGSVWVRRLRSPVDGDDHDSWKSGDIQILLRGLCKPA